MGTWLLKGRAYHRGTPEERFNARVQRSEGCWEYQGHRHRGYGKFGVSPSESVLAHRFAYALWVGEIPEAAVVHHLCENPACVRPDHLVLKTNEGHSHDHTYGRGVVENQYGVWPEGWGVSVYDVQLWVSDPVSVNRKTAFRRVEAETERKAATVAKREYEKACAPLRVEKVLSVVEAR